MYRNISSPRHYFKYKAFFCFLRQMHSVLLYDYSRMSLHIFSSTLLRSWNFTSAELDGKTHKLKVDFIFALAAPLSPLSMVATGEAQSAASEKRSTIVIITVCPEERGSPVTKSTRCTTMDVVGWLLNGGGPQGVGVGTCGGYGRGRWR